MGVDNFKKVLLGETKISKKGYLANFLGTVVPATPIFALGESVLPKEWWGLFPELAVGDSVEARLKMATFTLIGAPLYSYGRDISKNIFGINAFSEEWKKGAHDMLYSLVLGIPISFALYFSDQSLNLSEAWNAVIGAEFLTIPAGIGIGYGIDSFRDFLGVQDSKRLPRVIQNLPKKIKYGLAVGLVAGSVGLTAGIYELKEEVDSRKEISVGGLEEGVLKEDTYDATNYFFGGEDD